MTRDERTVTGALNEIAQAFNDRFGGPPIKQAATVIAALDVIARCVENIPPQIREEVLGSSLEEGGVESAPTEFQPAAEAARAKPIPKEPAKPKPTERKKAKPAKKPEKRS